MCGNYLSLVPFTKLTHHTTNILNFIKLHSSNRLPSTIWKNSWKWLSYLNSSIAFNQPIPRRQQKQPHFTITLLTQLSISLQRPSSTTSSYCSDFRGTKARPCPFHPLLDILIVTLSSLLFFFCWCLRETYTSALIFSCVYVGIVNLCLIGGLISVVCGDCWVVFVAWWWRQKWGSKTERLVEWLGCCRRNTFSKDALLRSSSSK